jgi:hypothetical protein
MRRLGSQRQSDAWSPAKFAPSSIPWRDDNDRHNRISRKCLPFLLNFRDWQIRYYRHVRNLGFRGAKSVRTTGHPSIDALRWNRTMSLIRPIAWLAAVLAILGTTSSAQAQYHQPFIDPSYFNPDFQFFAPAEVSAYSGGEPANIGFYLDYDRLFLNVTRPEGEPSFFSPFQGDFTWGNRWELGYMTEEDSGWNFVYWNLSGPSKNYTLLQERIDRINDDDDPPDDPDPILQDRNPRWYNLYDSLNTAKFASTEFNKTWRKKPFHNGSIFEPLVGLRYMNFQDRYRRDTYTRYDETGPIPGPPGQPDPADPNVEGEYEELSQDLAKFENAMFGGQVGFRYFGQRGHWLLSCELRAFALQNYQTLYNTLLVTQTRYSGLGGDVELQLRDRTDTITGAEEFVFGGEVRAEASYELTRDINLRFGGMFMNLAKGIGRGNEIRFNQQDVQMAGVTFGFTVNR